MQRSKSCEEEDEETEAMDAVGELVRRYSQDQLAYDPVIAIYNSVHIAQCAEVDSTKWRTHLLNSGSSWISEGDDDRLKSVSFWTSDWARGRAAGDAILHDGSSYTFEAEVIEPAQALKDLDGESWTTFFTPSSDTVFICLSLLGTNMQLYLSLSFSSPSLPKTFRRHSTSALSPSTLRGRIIRSQSSDGNAFTTYATIAARPPTPCKSPISPTFKTLSLPRCDTAVDDDEETEDEYYVEFPVPTSPIKSCFKQVRPIEHAVKQVEKPRRKSSFGGMQQRGRSTSISGLNVTRSQMTLPIMHAKWQDTGSSVQLKHLNSHPQPKILVEEPVAPSVGQRMNLDYSNGFELL